MSDVIAKAQELAEAITNSPELAAFREAEEVMENDPSAEPILTEFITAQKAIQETHYTGVEVTPEMKQALEDVQEKMRAHASISVYLDNQTKVNNLLQSVNFIITKALQGEDSSCNPSAGCGSGCHSCG